MVFKILGKRDRKKTVSDNAGNDVVKVTKMLEFLTEVEPSRATIGSIVVTVVVIVSTHSA